MRTGYISVSRDKQTTALQEDAMQKEHCEWVFTDKMSGKPFDRSEFLKMFDMVRSEDVIVVWRLDRRGRSLQVCTDRLLIHLLEGEKCDGSSIAAAKT